MSRLGFLVVLVACAAATSVAQAAGPVGAYTTRGAYRYVSAPRLHPPRIFTDAPTRNGLAAGYFMTATSKNLALPGRMVGQGGPLILDDHLEPVWVHPVPTQDLSLNLLKQTYLGRPVLSWWQGEVAPSNGPLFARTGTDVIVDAHYRTIKSMHGVGGWVLSPHEFLLNGGDAWVTAYKTVPFDLTPYGGPLNGQVIDTAVQEYDVRTNALRWQWDALAHVPPAESYAAIGTDGVWDPYHMNSIDLSVPGKLLVSLRNTWAVYQVDRATGNVDWRLGGKDSSFTLGPGAVFSWQHDAKWAPHGELSIFDDGCCPASGPQANGPGRGLFLRLSMARHTATVARQYTHHGLEVGSQGSVQVLPNSNVMIGWGQQPWFSEYSAGGRLLFDARYPNPDISYRVYKQRWTGTPFYPPSLAVRRHGSHVTAFVSWNGATSVRSWRILAGAGRKRLRVAVARLRRRGFETAVVLNRASYVKARALDGRGHLLGSSKTVHVSGG